MSDTYDTTFEVTQKGVQFGRFIEIRIKNFVTGIETTISNDFEIEFDFHKTVDENQQASTGEIKIYGLSKERIESLKDEGGEVTLYCGYTNSRIERLFTAYITQLYPEKSNSNITTIIKCSSNSMNYYFNGSQSSQANGGNSSYLEVLSRFSKAVGNTTLDIDLNNIPEKDRADVEKFFRTRSFRVDYTGNAQHMLSELCGIYNLNSYVDSTEKGNVLRLSLTATSMNKIMREVNEGYEQVKPFEVTQDMKDFRSLFVTPESLASTAVFLSYNTGLREVKTEYKIATAYADQELRAGETQTLQSQKKQLEQNAQLARQQAKDAKRKAEGKKVKDRVVKRQKIKVNRQFARVSALLNPSVKPQTIIIINSQLDNIVDQYRVREANYSGNNKRGDFIMDLYCEDTNLKNIKQLSAQEEAKYNSENNEFNTYDIEQESEQLGDD